MRINTVVLAAVAAIGFSPMAMAVPFTGQLSITTFGAVTTPTTVTVDQASGISFAPNLNSTVSQTLAATQGGIQSFTSTNATIGNGTGGTINDIANFSTYSTGTLFTLSDGLTFTLNAPLDITRTAASSRSLAQLGISGTGTFSGDGFDATAGVFTITTQGTQATLNLASGSGTASAVPEPMSIALLGGSLTALGLVRRRR
ncbi:MAG: PEP-CTERM sorting domain-containing protein [Acetobacteraceae bacterium]|nr:PEP-CTERM sorting domain-containing protein [Acetobacteraceae bacterium]